MWRRTQPRRFSEAHPDGRAPDPLRERAARAASTRLKLIIPIAIVLLAVVALTLVDYGGRESTDDAQVDGHITQIAARWAGRVVRVST